MTPLTDATEVPSIWTVKFQSAYKPPFHLAAYGKGNYQGEDTACLCAMEAISVSQGVDKTDSPNGVHPIFASLVRRINDGIIDDEERTEVLWPLLPNILGTAWRYRRWEADIYKMILKRPLSTLELDGIGTSMDSNTIGYSLILDMESHYGTIPKAITLLDFAIRGYWDAKAMMPPLDWSGKQYSRLAGWLDYCKVNA